VAYSAVIDIFCGAGGLSHGFVLEGFPVLAGIDADPACEYPFRKNNRGIFIHKAIEDIDPTEITKLYPKGSITILVGCAPCQPFSSYSVKTTTGDKWKLLYKFSQLISKVSPDIVSMENVTQLRRFAGGKVFGDFVDSLSKEGYFVSDYDVYCPAYGIPQRRTRLVLFASRFGHIDLIPPTHQPATYRTVRMAISRLSPLQPGEASKLDPLHRASSLSKTNFERIKASRPGGSWRDWDGNLIAACHKKTTGRTYPSVYGRMSWDEPAPTITTQFYGFGNGRFGHPEQHRALSLREAALLQTFPPKYEFVDPGKPFRIKTIGRLIGNAVPVKLGRVIAKSISKHLEASNEK
jgi:DNA (cytosine-5)-methyltransferase 1